MTMFNDFRKLAVIFLIVAVGLSGCQISRVTPTPTATQPNPSLIFTAAAQTAEARRALTATAQPTETPVPPTPTQTVTAAATSTLVFTSTQVVPGTTATSIPATSGPVSSSGDNAAFVEDRSIPDGTDFTAGATFVKTWRLMNTGTTTWTSSYSLVYISGDPLGAPASVAVPMEVSPNQVVDISVNMVAPNTSGNYKSYWRMRNAAGALFGQSIYADIDVVGEGETSNNQPTPTGQSGGSVVSGVSISIEESTATAECPHEFNVTASFTLLEPTTVTYEFEAGSDIAGFTFDLPDPVTTNFASGTQVLTFTLEITDSGNGWVQLHISSPEEVSSAKANFTLNCED